MTTSFAAIFDAEFERDELERAERVAAVPERPNTAPFDLDRIAEAVAAARRGHRLLGRRIEALERTVRRSKATRRRPDQSL